jgi:hypothetical protein
MQANRDETVFENREENVPLEPSVLGTDLDDDVSTSLESATLAPDSLLLHLSAENNNNKLADSSANAHATAAAAPTSANFTTIFFEEFVPPNRHAGPMAICCYINHILCERFGGRLVCFSFMLKFLSPTVICALATIVNITIFLLFVYQLCYRKYN